MRVGLDPPKLSRPRAGSRELGQRERAFTGGLCTSRGRTISGRTATLGADSEHERHHLLPFSAEGFPIHEVLCPLVVDGQLYCVNTNKIRRRYNLAIASAPHVCSVRVRIL
jgi:hypothetical protein